MHWICGLPMWKIIRLLDALWRPLFLVKKSSRSLLGSTSKYDSGRLEQYMKNLRNFFKIYAFRPEVYLEVFQVQIRTTLYFQFYSLERPGRSSYLPMMANNTQQKLNISEAQFSVANKILYFVHSAWPWNLILLVWIYLSTILFYLKLVKSYK